MNSTISGYKIEDLIKNAYMEGRADSEYEQDHAWENSDSLGLIEGRIIDLRYKDKRI